MTVTVIRIGTHSPGRAKDLVSAGGVVYRFRNDTTEIAVCGRRSPRIWGLPKGKPEEGETLEETALREVAEETGLKVRTEAHIDSIQYWFVAAGVRYHKTTHFYLMSVTGGDTSLHDCEYDLVEWVPAWQALKILTHENEARIVEKGLAMASQEASC